MKQISFNDLPEDIYKIIIDYIVNHLDRNDFKNYTIANPKSLLNNYVKSYVDKTVLNLHITNYFNFIDIFATENKVHMQKKFDEIYTNLSPENHNFYKELIGFVVNSNYYNYNNTEKTIIYDNLSDLIPFYSTHYPRTQYYHLIDRLLNIYNIRGRNQFRISFMIFVSRLKDDLIKNDITMNKIVKIIIKVINSFNWENENNII